MAHQVTAAYSVELSFAHNKAYGKRGALHSTLQGEPVVQETVALPVLVEQPTQSHQHWL